MWEAVYTVGAGFCLEGRWVCPACGVVPVIVGCTLDAAHRIQWGCFHSQLVSEAALLYLQYR